MKRWFIGSVMLLAACEGGAAIGATSGSAMREYLVIGGRMTFEECRARGGLIIRDAGSPMVACDPNVIREPVPADEFDHPTAQPAG